MRNVDKKWKNDSSGINNNRVSLIKSGVPYGTSNNRSNSVSNSAFISQQDNNHSIGNLNKIPLKYTFYLGRGNNESLVRKILLQRGCWVQCMDSTSTFTNFKWQQDQKGYKYNRLQDSGIYKSCVNHFQFHQCLSNKQNLFRNLEAFCDKMGDDIWKIVPPTFILNVKDQCSMQFLKLFTQYYQKYYPKKSKDQNPEYEKQIHEQKRKLKNFFFNANEKKNLTKMPYLPPVFINQEEGDYLWIMKPTFLNRGRGIQIFSTLDQLNKYVSQNINGYIEKSLNNQFKKEERNYIDYIKRNTEHTKLPSKEEIFQENKLKRKTYLETKDNSQTFDGNQFIRVIPRSPSVIKTDCFLIQKYLERPLLLLNHKFDIRMWVLVSHNLSFFVFKEGYVRLSSLEYQCKFSENNTSMHLTNNAVQKFTSEYGKIAQGNQMSFKQLRKCMEDQKLDWDNCLSIIHKHMQKSLSASVKKLNPLGRRFVFQIFGYDFMIDDTGYPWLIEVNNNPCIEQSSQMLGKLLHRMLDDGFKLTLDVIFPGNSLTAKYPVEGYRDNQNMWKPLNI